MNLTRAAIEKNRITSTTVGIVVVAGALAFFSLPRAEDPGFTVRTAVVVTHFPGASPERIEQLVTDKLEKAIQEMPELDYIASQSKKGMSVINVQIKESYDQMRSIWDDLRRKVDRAALELPDGVIGPIVDDEFGDIFGTVVTLTGDGFSYAELEDIAEEVRHELLLIKPVAKVEIHGAQEERIFVEYNNARLAELGISPAQLGSIIEYRNIINPGGDVRTEDEEIALEPSGNLESVEDLGRTVISLPGQSELIYLEDVAQIVRGYIDPPRTRVRVSGVPGLALGISLQEDQNITVLGAEVRRVIAQLQDEYPIGIDFGFAQFEADNVNRKINDFTVNLLQAVVIVVVVMLLSMGVRAGLVVASLIPATILMSLLVMSVLDVGLDQMSLSALIIALGLLVDNAIVMSESIQVMIREGKTPIAAAVDSASELRTPLLVSSLTTAAAFLPIYLAQSSVGEYTSPLFTVVTITLLCSWILAVTLTPMLCVRFLKTQNARDRSSSKLHRYYLAFLLRLLQHPWLALASVTVVFLGALRLSVFVPAVFFPPNDRPTLKIELRLPTGSPLSRTEAIAREVERFLDEELRVTPEAAAQGAEGVTDWVVYIGSGGPRFLLAYDPEPISPEYAILVVNTTSRGYVDQAVAKMRQYCSAHFPELKAQVNPLPHGPPVTNPVEVRVTARDVDTVVALADHVQAHLRTLPGPRNVSDDWGARSKKLAVRIDEARSRRAGVTNQDIAVSLQALLSGIEITEYRQEDKVIPVTLRSVSADRHDLSKLHSLNVFSQASGQAVPLKQVADIEVAWQPSKIRRRNSLKTVTVGADLTPGFTAGEVDADLVRWLHDTSKSWPPGASWELGGVGEQSQDGNRSIGVQLPVAGLLIVLLLVGQFNSLRRTLIVLITIPLGLIGVVIGLLVMRSYFGFVTFLGVISLAGIVINNAIVLLDRIRIEIEDNGLSPQRAIVQSALRRLRPILLTTVTTVGGLIPLYLGGGPLFEPMAVAIMFGLVFATLLTLGVVPALYTLFFAVKFKGFNLSDGAPVMPTAQDPAL